MADTTTTNYGWTKPEVGSSANTWGTKLNASLDGVDTTVKAVSDVADAALPKAGGTMTGDLVLAGDPDAALKAATKQYVDGLLANVGTRASVRAATTANITIASALNNGDTLDGVTLATGDWVLVKNQSSAAENGVYEVAVSPVRVTPFDTYDEHPGSLIAVQEGSTNADTLWLCTSNVGGTLDTTALAYSKMTTSGEMIPSSYPTLVSLEGLSLVAGDILYATAADTLARLAKGTDDQVLTLASGVPSWADASGGGTGGDAYLGSHSIGTATSFVLTSIENYSRLRFHFIDTRHDGTGFKDFFFGLSNNNGSSYTYIDVGNMDDTADDYIFDLFNTDGGATKLADIGGTSSGLNVYTGINGPIDAIRLTLEDNENWDGGTLHVFGYGARD